MTSTYRTSIPRSMSCMSVPYEANKQPTRVICYTSCPKPTF